MEVGLERVGARSRNAMAHGKGRSQRDDRPTIPVYTRSNQGQSRPEQRNCREIAKKKQRRYGQAGAARDGGEQVVNNHEPAFRVEDRKSTRLNSSHSQISYAVFCLKKKKRSLY